MEDSTNDDWETAGEIPHTDLNIKKTSDLKPVTQEKSSSNSDKQTKDDNDKTLLVNFNDVSITEYLRFISRVSGKNFLFDDDDLNFKVTIMSEEPTSIENMLTALMQILRVHGLSMIEDDNNILIHRNPDIKSIGRVVTDDTEGSEKTSELVTRVFRLNTLSTENVVTMIRPMMSELAAIEILANTNHIIVTDLSKNVDLVSQLIKSVDSPASGLTLGQYFVVEGDTQSTMSLAQQIMTPIAKDQPILFIPNRGGNTIFVVASPFLVEKALSIMSHLDQSQGRTKMYDLKDLKFGHLGSDKYRQFQGWEQDESGNWIFKSDRQGKGSPKGNWYLNDKGHWIYLPEGTPFTTRIKEKSRA